MGILFRRSGARRGQTKRSHPLLEDGSVTPPWCHHHSPWIAVQGLSRLRAWSAKPPRANGRVPKPATAPRRFTGWLKGVWVGDARRGARTVRATLCCSRDSLPAAPRRRRFVYACRRDCITQAGARQRMADAPMRRRDRTGQRRVPCRMRRPRCATHCR
jgi:hypothetical protein